MSRAEHPRMQVDSGVLGHYLASPAQCKTGFVCGPAYDLGEELLAAIEAGGRHCDANSSVVFRIVDDKRCDRTNTDL